MITLTTPAQLATVLGGTTKTNYDRFEITAIAYDLIAQSVSGMCRLVCSGNASAAPVPGSFFIPVANGLLMTVSLPTLPFLASITLTPAEQVAVQGWITAAQNTVEQGIVAVGAVTGTQASGL